MWNLLRTIKIFGKESLPFFQTKLNQRKRSHLQKMMICMKRMETTSNKFSFKYEDRKKFLTEIQNLNSRKASQHNDIPVKILKENSDICSYILHHNFNNSLFSNKFPKYLKKADITPVP